ncbi:rhodanese-like domain-containing protein [Psychrobium sp. 1_MG-2023]|uniref:rhodanese-like domain-containing protein n=1 Tax=Psychrobium sp. 1_MG-2023 TaxID=3062624 RepID=UPI000C34D8F5|nr:rhodanese-like domain-containing protein [Psychrobium sp. 1_MG-2023]MDP2561236.1 rhodanese-like domain-containing protein [Psychrobium sp. 1_MG-2023]PKF55261.1 sulfurtransferase [Alteromonadales bacterium alter-6D02]
MKPSKEFLALAQQASKNVAHTDIETLARWQEEQRDFLLIDVREQSEWDNGHLPDAIHLSRGIIERDIVARVPDFEHILVLYCGAGPRSSLAGESLQKMGYRNIISLDGGFMAWKQADYAVVTSN